jgi:hypothetical protein
MVDYSHASPICCIFSTYIGGVSVDQSSVILYIRRAKTPGHPNPVNAPFTPTAL